MQISVLLGAPGSGKGTQAKELCKEGTFVHLSTGDVLRKGIEEGTELGKKAKVYMDAGKLVPDDLMIGLLEDTLAALSEQAQVLLDGFPRTVAQAQALDHSAAKVTQAIYFTIPKEILVERITGRRSCSNCGAVYHSRFRPPKTENICDECQHTPLSHRADDTEEVVRQRLQVFWEQNGPLTKFYKQRNQLKEIDANQEIESVQIELRKMFH